MTQSISDEAYAAQITCMISDIDGVMTDGCLLYDSTNGESKAFHVRDGLGIQLWRQAGFQFGVITGRKSPMVARRCDELGIVDWVQGHDHKWPAAQEMMRRWNVRPDQVAYLGDDLPDLAVMSRVTLAAAPADAARDVIEQAHWVLRTRGGQGVVRECVERLLRAGGRWANAVQSTAFPETVNPDADGTG
ncbi:MAG: HAD hydrolase family protein [Planctomycetota bacterium]